MDRASWKRLGVLVVSALGIFVAAASCDDDFDYRNCDYTIRRCRVVCGTYWCDGWGCYPSCWNQCWDDCYRYPRPDPEPIPVSDGGTVPGPAIDGGSSSGGGNNGSGVLCGSCRSNDDCENGALCILRGGPTSSPDASTPDGGISGGNGFCGHACQTTSDCPSGFTCTQIGSVKQCLPNNGTCN